MKVHNNQPSFGMALKVNKSTLKAFENFGILDDFNKELPALKAATRDVNVRIYHVDNPYCAQELVYEATPLNKLKMNNVFSYAYNLIRNKVGNVRTETDVQAHGLKIYNNLYEGRLLFKKEDFKNHTFLSKVEEAKNALASKINESKNHVKSPIDKAMESLKNQ